MTSSAGYMPGDAIVVTGAAQGIGRAIALALAGRGLALALWDIHGDGVRETAKACREAGVKATFDLVDVSKPDDVNSASRNAIEQHGQIYGLISNAGIFPRANILDADLELWQRVLGVNLLGAVLCAKSLLPVMIEAKRGAIVNIASGRALQGTPGGAHYACSKAAIISFTKSLALEMAPHQIRVNCLVPGLTETAQPLADAPIEELVALAERTIPIGRIGQPEDLTGAICFLLSTDSAFMTGQTIAVNGGAIMIP